LANVAKIKAQEYQSPSGGGSSASIPSTQAQMSAAQAQVPTQEKSTVSSQGSLGNIIPSPNVSSLTTPGATQAQMTGKVVGQSVNDQQQPIQTYVVGTQVSSQQQLDRRVALSARMGG
jgi:molybdopterin biosynthesis enzyme